jgi:hypothetical protein
VREVTAVAPELSVTRRLTLTWPGVPKERVTLGLAPVLVSKVPSPSRSHSYCSTVPSASLEAEASRVTASPTLTLVGAVKLAVGGWLPFTPAKWFATWVELSGRS